MARINGINLLRCDYKIHIVSDNRENLNQISLFDLILILSLFAVSLINLYFDTPQPNVTLQYNIMYIHKYTVKDIKKFNM